MNIKIATKVAICGVATGLIMSVLYPPFNQWVNLHYFRSGETAETGRMLASGYTAIRSMAEDGGMLIFLITILQRQKGE
jgi:hypothetical protein